jgi:Helix-turn-helix domain
VDREPEAIAERRRALGAQLATFGQAADLTQGQLARMAFCDRTAIVHIEKGRARADERFWQVVDEACDAQGVLLAAYIELAAAKAEHEQNEWEQRLADARAKVEVQQRPADVTAARHQVKQDELDALRARHQIPSSSALRERTDLVPAVWSGDFGRDNGEQEALELARRVAASDVSTETLSRLEQVVDELAVKYPVTPPAELLPRVRRHVAYVMHLVDARKTLDEHRRLLVVGGWLSLLAATLSIDVEQRSTARQWLATAASLAGHSGQNEILAWRVETEAWQLLTEGRYRQAADLAQAAQAMAPHGSSAAIQATAQEGRAWARLGEAKDTYRALADVERAVSTMARPDQPEHHYRYDPDRSIAYVATTLAWLGDVAAEHYAREVVAKLEGESAAGRWPRRLASANLDLSLSLLLTDKLDEACSVAQTAILSGRLVPSNHWRVLEVVKKVEARELPKRMNCVRRTN